MTRVIPARSTILSLTGLLVISALSGCASTPATRLTTPAKTAGQAGFSAFVTLGPQGAPIARVITRAAQCPVIHIGDRDVAMDLRAAPAVLPLRPTRSDPANSKPSVFALRVCEKTIPPHTRTASVYGQPLPLPVADIRRIVVIGDTGCRLKKGDDDYQACNDSNQYAFSRVAAAAARWRPDLVIHVGDYLYRENRCPAGNTGCAGSPWGYGWDAWQADFFKPGAALLRAAPWVMVRGNHESCSRGGQGWWRFIDPRPLVAGRDCNDPANDDIGDFSAAYAVPLGDGAQIIVMDTADTINKPIAKGSIRAKKYSELYRQISMLAQQARYNIGVDHHPLLGFTAGRNAQGDVTLAPGNRGLQSVFGRINPLLLPPGIDLMLSGHIHVWEAVSFSSPYPAQFIAGFSGTQEDIVPLPAQLPAQSTPAPGAIVAHFSSWVNGFGFMTMERSGPDQWQVQIHDAAGKQVNACHVNGHIAVCDQSQVESPTPIQP